MNKKSIDIICVGEALIDLIGDELSGGLVSTKKFHKYVGGSPTNVAINMSQLGLNVALIATLGQDSFGEFIKQKLVKSSVSTQYISYSKEKATSLIAISKSKTTPEFIPYRQADRFIELNQIPDNLLANTSIFHTTCFALSQNPAQTTILTKAKEAYEAGCQLSIDLNYAPKIWGKNKVLKVLKVYCKYKSLVKISEDDAIRIFGQETTSQHIFNYFHNLGAKIVCYTKGKNGAIVSELNGEVCFIDAPKIKKIKDATGAGDAFWSGFLAAYLHKFPINLCLKAGNNLVAKKIQHVGGLPKSVSLKDVLDIKAS